MNTKSLVQIGIILVAVGGAVFLVARYITQPSAVPEEGPQLRRFICGNGHEFSYTAGEFKRKYGGQRIASVTCPECGNEELISARECPNCNRYYEPAGHGMRVKVCPHCGQDVPTAIEERTRESG